MEKVENEMQELHAQLDKMSERVNDVKALPIKTRSTSDKQEDAVNYLFIVRMFISVHRNFKRNTDFHQLNFQSFVSIYFISVFVDLTDCRL